MFARTPLTPPLTKYVTDNKSTVSDDYLFDDDDALYSSIMQYIITHPFSLPFPLPLPLSQALSVWLCRFHNAVNANLGKPASSCDPDYLIQRYRDGPADGSCD